MSHVAGRTVENDDLVNFPNWLALSIRIEDGDWFDARRCRLLSYRQELELQRDVLVRIVRFEDDGGRRTTLAERRLVSMDDRHVAALKVMLTAENWSAPVTIRSGVDGPHLVPVLAEAVGDDGVCLVVRTPPRGGRSRAGCIPTEERGAQAPPPRPLHHAGACRRSRCLSQAAGSSR